MYVQFGPLQQQSDWRTTTTTKKQKHVFFFFFYTRALQNEEKFAFICMNILAHNIEKLYVNKYQSGSSPEIEQLRQSELGGQLQLQYTLSSTLKLLFLNGTIFPVSTFESIRVCSMSLSLKKRMSNFVQVCPRNHIVYNALRFISTVWICVAPRLRKTGSWNRKSYKGLSSPKPKKLSTPFESSVCVFFFLFPFLPRLLFLLQVFDPLSPGHRRSSGRCVKCVSVAVINPLPPRSRPTTQTCHLEEQSDPKLLNKTRAQKNQH